MEFVISLLTVALFFSCVVYLYVKYKQTYWSRSGSPYIVPSFLLGNFGNVMLRKISFTDQISEFYNKTKLYQKFTGLYFFITPSLLINEPEMTKKILCSDFYYFHNRGMYHDENSEPLSANLVSLSGEKWKSLRAKLTATFTPGKLKIMFDLVLKCAEEMCDVLKGENQIEISDLTARYTTDVVGSTAFGIDCNSLKNPDAEFRKIGKLATTINQTSIVSVLKRITFRSFPGLARKLKLKVLHPLVSSFFMKVVRDTVEFRNKNDVNRNDFLQLLIKLMDKDNIKFGEGNSLTMNQVAAQCFVFFIAGVETSASTVTFALYELACQGVIQDKLRKEILEIIKEHDGKLTYNAIMKMNYLDKVVLETMRKYPAFTVIMRRCTENYLIPETNVVLEKGTSVIIPVYSFHHDPNFYPKPEEFNPERFNEEGVKSRTDHTYLPFGSGPRNCIGSRFAMIQVKVALCTLLRNFQFNINEKSKGVLVMDKSSFILSTSNGIWLDIVPVV